MVITLHWCAPSVRGRDGPSDCQHATTGQLFCPAVRGEQAPSPPPDNSGRRQVRARPRLLGVPWGQSRVRLCVQRRFSLRVRFRRSLNGLLFCIQYRRYF